MSGSAGKKDRRLNLRVSEEIYQTYEELARIEKTSVSAVVRSLLEQAAPLLGQLALAASSVEEAVARQSATDALQAVRVFQGVAQQLQGGGESMAAMSDMMTSHLERYQAEQTADNGAEGAGRASNTSR